MSSQNISKTSKHLQHLDSNLDHLDHKKKNCPKGLSNLVIKPASMDTILRISASCQEHHQMGIWMEPFRKKPQKHEDHHSVHICIYIYMYGYMIYEDI